MVFSVVFPAKSLGGGGSVYNFLTEAYSACDIVGGIHRRAIVISFSNSEANLIGRSFKDNGTSCDTLTYNGRYGPY
jgi:hypothetical protein